jgi:hypothetical protein
MQKNRLPAKGGRFFFVPKCRARQEPENPPGKRFRAAVFWQNFHAGSETLEGSAVLRERERCTARGIALQNLSRKDRASL